MEPNEEGVVSVTAISPINIALIKYWGKMHDTLIIPTNSSLSITIDTDALRTKTKITLKEPKKGDEEVRLILNGEHAEISERIKNVIRKVKEVVRT